MNLLIDQFPAAVEIDGRDYALNTDFRTCLLIILAFEDPDLVDIERQAVLLDNLYREKPENVRAALELGLKFLNGGKSGEEAEEEPQPRVYSFAKDAELIFAAFRQTHGIDLETAEMHWWKFLALFMDLGADTTFCNLVSLRKRIKTGKATKEEQAMAREMGDLVEIPEPDTRTLEEKDREAEFMRLVEIGERNRVKANH